MPKYIAERKLIAVRLDSGERKVVTYRVGIPYWTAGDEFASCPIEFEGVFDQLAETKGVDQLQALHLASDLDGFLRILRCKYEFYWQSGDPYFDDEAQS